MLKYCSSGLSIIHFLEASVGRGKPWCKGRNSPGGKECCEFDDPEEDKCTEGQGDCDSDAGCAGNLICGRNNCRVYHENSSVTDDCCTQQQQTISTRREDDMTSLSPQRHFDVHVIFLLFLFV